MDAGTRGGAGAEAPLSLALLDAILHSGTRDRQLVRWHGDSDLVEAHGRRRASVAELDRCVRRARVGDGGIGGRRLRGHWRTAAVCHQEVLGLGGHFQAAIGLGRNGQRIEFMVVARCLPVARIHGQGGCARASVA
ncbi:hypothetical protein D3C81_1698430 [compost metagenome]